MIVPDADDFNDNGYITGIAGKKNFTVVAIEKNSMNNEIGFGRRVLAAIEKNGLNFEHMPSGIDTLSIVIADAQVKEKLQQLIDDIYTECQPDSIEVFDNLALVATVGRGMIKHVGIAAKLFGALAESGVNIRMIDQGSSELNIIVGVETSDFEKTIKAIYSAFC
jgi:aspartate kinase